MKCETVFPVYTQHSIPKFSSETTKQVAKKSKGNWGWQYQETNSICKAQLLQYTRKAGMMTQHIITISLYRKDFMAIKTTSKNKSEWM